MEYGVFGQMGPIDVLRKLRAQERAAFDARQRDFCRLGRQDFGSERRLILRKYPLSCSDDGYSQQKRFCKDCLGRDSAH